MMELDRSRAVVKQSEGPLDLTKPISTREYEGYEPNDIPGLGKYRNVLYQYVHQGLEGVSYDIPLVSDGFGPCWAAIVFDRTSGRSCLIHVDDFEAKEEQRAQIEKHLSLPNSGAREAVILHALRTHAGEFSKEYFYKIGCQRVDIISFDSQSKHWAIGYYPEQNVFDIVTKTGVQGSIATRYRAFSDAVYDSEMRSTQNLSEKLFEKDLDSTKHSTL